MKLIFVLGIAVCLVAVTQAGPVADLITGITSSLGSLSTGINGLLTNVGTATGTLLQTGVSVGLQVLSLPLQLLPLTQSLLTTVSGIVNSAVSQIVTILSNAGNTLQTVGPALQQIQTILQSTVTSLNALGNQNLSGLTSIFRTLASSVGTVLSQISASG
ncbi:AGAP007830-PA-like protein [Anopheles sinensis]|uniref:AGAP007830-PA-like protein n=1 Tax=Anopheles sinensis TaxID=74873 RepID=A0A084VBB6_ANOSI|nr:AGAP007830-PA-like protein [Anopheles sinensis]